MCVWGIKGKIGIKHTVRDITDTEEYLSLITTTLVSGWSQCGPVVLQATVQPLVSCQNLLRTLPTVLEDL